VPSIGEHIEHSVRGGAEGDERECNAAFRSQLQRQQGSKKAQYEGERNGMACASVTKGGGVSDMKPKG
jgi:hypothetical protein